jgi:import inner membrane translocase subunit TIM17
MGAIGGSIWHGVKGLRLSPAGSKLSGSGSFIAARAPVLGGQFAVWGGLFACCDCTLTAIRQKEDPWNSIVSGAATGGILAGRAGPKAMASAAVVGGVLLALIEGMGIMFTKMMAPPVPTAEDYQRAMDPTAPPTTMAGGGSSLMDYMRGSSTTSPPPSSTAAPPSTLEPSFGMETTFSTEGSSSEEQESSTNNGKSSWFGGWSK